MALYSSAVTHKVTSRVLTSVYKTLSHDKFNLFLYEHKWATKETDFLLRPAVSW